MLKKAAFCILVLLPLLLFISMDKYSPRPNIKDGEQWPPYDIYKGINFSCSDGEAPLKEAYSDDYARILENVAVLIEDEPEDLHDKFAKKHEVYFPLSLPPVRNYLMIVKKKKLLFSTVQILCLLLYFPPLVSLFLLYR